MSDQIKQYPGDEADVRWDGRLCIHVGECGRSNDTLFEAGREPWCDPNTVDGAKVSTVIKRCPTGALTFTPKNGMAEEAAPGANRIVVSNHGPLYVTGDLAIDGAADDMPGVKFRAALCRCGKSANKPFCDNAHEKSGFQDRGAIGDEGPGFDAAGGKLTIKKAADGPLLLSGNVELVTAAGRVAWRGTKAALCRCGQSKNKPFCDGAHKAAGFKG